VNERVERIWKKAVLTCSRYYPGIYLDELRKTKTDLRIAGVQAAVWVQNL
jgi:hypothetical protein